METDAFQIRRTLRWNAEFSAVSGLAMVAAAGLVAGLLFRGVDGPFGLSMAGFLRIIGIVVLAFAVDVFLVSLAKRPRRLFVAAIMVADWLWVAGSLVLVFLARDLLTTGGIAAVLVVAAVVAGFGVAEWRGLGRLRRRRVS